VSALSWLRTWQGANAQRGFPEPEALGQRRQPAWPITAPFAGVAQIHTRPYSRGAAGYVPIAGIVYSNPIGSGVVSTARPRASYGRSSVYVNHTIFWTFNTAPISVPLHGLSSPDVVNALIAQGQVDAVLPTA
jgi:hypothetical protein